METRIMKLQKSKGQITVTIPKEFVVKGGYEEEDYVVVNLKQKGALLIRKVGFYGKKAGDIQKGRCKIN